jgi:amphi-Trp domain-containing protein
MALYWPADGLREPMAARVPARFRGQARRDAAAFYLTQLAKGILAGEIAVQSGQEHTVVATSEFLSLDIEVRQRRRATRVEVKLRWPRQLLTRAVAKKRNREA